MKRMKAFDFDVFRIPGPAKLICKFITSSNDSVTFFGNTVEEIFEQCMSRFPEGFNTNKITFSGANMIDAKRNLFQLLSLGFSVGYFKESPQNYED